MTGACKEVAPAGGPGPVRGGIDDALPLDPIRRGPHLTRAAPAMYAGDYISGAACYEHRPRGDGSRANQPHRSRKPIPTRKDVAFADPLPHPTEEEAA